MSDTKKFEIKEACRAYNPPVNAARIVEQLLNLVPTEYLRGLDCIVLTNLSGQPRRRRLGKVTRRGRRMARSQVAGLYHPKWKGQLPWIELYVDQILRSMPRWTLRLPFLKDFALAHTLYHELGHHVHLTIRPEYREEEDVADEWGRKFTRNFIRRRHWYLIPVAKLIRLFSRRKNTMA